MNIHSAQSLVKNSPHGHYEVEGFLDGERTNPFARICCKTRKLTPTLCDGTCLDCKKARQEYSLGKSTKILQDEIIRSGGDSEYEIPSREEALRLTLAHIANIEKAKALFFREHYSRVNQIDTLLAQKFGSSPETTLH